MNGFSRGMLIKGAGNVIGTLWPIPDRATAFFMEEFYSALKLNNGNAKSALADTKRKFLTSGRYRHPYYWSGFVLYSADKSSLKNVLGG